MLHLLFLADIVGKLGRASVKEHLPALREKFSADIVIANGENAAGGLGIDAGTAQEIFLAGVDVITTGNHVWDKKDVTTILSDSKHPVLRPINFPEGAPGSGVLKWTTPGGVTVGIINAIGRVFMPQLVDCPYRAIDGALTGTLADCAIRIVDFHGEATSEKVALGYYLDGRVSFVVGTHTHVQTADLRILPKGSAYMTDAGMCGPLDGVLGIKSELVVERFLTSLPGKFDLAVGPAQINGAFVAIDEESGLATSTKPIYEVIER